MTDDQQMDLHVKARFRAAARHARLAYPGAVGRLISREILSWQEFGYRLGSEALMNEVVAEVLKQPSPDADAA